jgi:hypothetical protein
MRCRTERHRGSLDHTGRRPTCIERRLGGKDIATRDRCGFARRTAITSRVPDDELHELGAMVSQMQASGFEVMGSASITR